MSFNHVAGSRNDILRSAERSSAGLVLAVMMGIVDGICDGVGVLMLLVLVHVK